LESRGRALAPIVEDPLAALDRFGTERGGAVAAPSALTFPRALLGGGSTPASPSHAARTDRKAEEKRLEEKKVEETAERVERAPHKALAPSPVRAAAPEPPSLPASPTASQPGVEEGTTPNRKLAALPRPLGAPGTTATRSVPSAAREVTAPKTLTTTVATTSRSPGAVSSPKEGAPSPLPKVLAAQPTKPAAPVGAKAAAPPLAKAAVPTSPPKSPVVSPPPPPVRTAALNAPVKPSAALAANPKTTAAPAHKGFLLQLSSFQDRSEADAFARRFAAENAYVVPTEVPGKGTVYRVRVGSYASLKEAAAAKTNFEQTHNVIAYVAGTGPAQ
ncbi:MAG TPA: SPOR domain-containing protein, partial [Polyangia bacterium]